MVHCYTPLLKYSWCVQVVATWEREFSKAARERRVAFIYLANHIMQESRKKGPDFVTQFQVLK